MMTAFAIWFQNLPLFIFLRNSTLAFPVILTLHVLFISVFGAMIFATDLRLLGWGLRKYSMADVIDPLRLPKRVGFVLVVTCGILVLGTKAEEYFLNPFFQLKILLLMLVGVHALLFRGNVYNNAAALDATPEPPARAKLAGAFSLLLWLGIACAGRSIGYINGPLGSHHFAALFSPLTRL
jgi:hypothetical protein